MGHSLPLLSKKKASDLTVIINPVFPPHRQELDLVQEGASASLRCVPHPLGVDACKFGKSSCLILTLYCSSQSQD